MSKMSAQLLQDALLKMPPTGEHGFEGLVAKLLSVLTGDRFYIARSGDQPADSVNSAGDVAIQTKRYGGSEFSETTFEGEFGRACRAFPLLDCYVFAATRRTAQLAALAHQLEQEHGVDILLVGFEGLDSELAALCVSFWRDIKDFPTLSELGDAFDEWVAGQASDPTVLAQVEKLRRQLTESIPLAATVRRKLALRLDARFGFAAAEAVRFAIDLPHSVMRPAPHADLNQWWNDKAAKASLVIGEEGMGKSVVAAAFAHSQSHQAALVLWLDSADWTGLRSISGAVDTGLMHAGFGDETLRKRLTRKALTRWSSKLLIVLDGVNERCAREAAHHLVAELLALGRSTPRLLFTSRPIAWHSDESALWRTAKQVPVDAFTDHELNQALASVNPPTARTELPSGLLETARIPRYFKRAVELRNRFESLRHISKEMVLWADLVEKIEAGDAQITDRLGGDLLPMRNAR